MDESEKKNGTHGGKRNDAGRKPYKDQSLVKVPLSTKIPRWLKEWLVSDEREESAPVMIEKALVKQYGAKPMSKEVSDSDRLEWMLKHRQSRFSRDARGNWFLAEGVYTSSGKTQKECIDKHINGEAIKQQNAQEAE